MLEGKGIKVKIVSGGKGIVARNRDGVGQAQRPGGRVTRCVSGGE